MAAPVPKAFQELAKDDPTVAKWLVDNIVAPPGGDDFQTQIDALDTRVTTNENDIDSNDTDILNLQNTNVEDWEHGSGTLSSGTVTISFGTTQADTNYYITVTLTANVDETLYVDQKTTSGFDVTSATGSSTATFDWHMRR